MSYLQTDVNKKKRVDSRSWYRHSDETKKLISETNKKTWTPARVSEKVETNRKNGVYKRSSETIKRKILSGEITPRTQNRLNHKRLKSDITGVKRYRSSWELIYHEANPILEYETLRVSYIFENINKIYIVDFWNPVEKIAIEIKPSNLTDNPKNKAKREALINWCKANEASYIEITERDFNFV
jgi:hypothetical protein